MRIARWIHIPSGKHPVMPAEESSGFRRKRLLDLLLGPDKESPLCMLVRSVPE